MGEINSLAGFIRHQVVCLGAICTFLLPYALLFPAQAYALNEDETSALIQRLPVSTKVTELEARSRIRHWQAFIESVRNMSEIDKLVAVNDYFNTLRFIEDANLWHRSDYWATPLQVLAGGAGDCEDFAIAKYFSLKTLGVANEHLRITYVWNHHTLSGRSEPHMVLTYTASENAEPLVLDILTNDIHTLAQRKDLEPVYSLNSEGLWLVGDDAGAILAGSPAQLPQWRQMSQAMGSDAALLQMQ